jgi:hypothetical protein
LRLTKHNLYLKQGFWQPLDHLHFTLQHCSGDISQGTEVDVPQTYGDYFAEAMRCYKQMRK